MTILGTKEAEMRGEGDSLPYTPGADRVGGEVIVEANIVGIVTSAILSGVKGSLQITGRAEFKCKSADDLTVGLKVYWDAGNNHVTLTASSNTNLGLVTIAAGAGVTEVEVLMLPQGIDLVT
ncbi:MAG: DUF2190 family protein [Planctomycetes bacterium]|nr:DUF2190 family protein [Planctomycetota bacterium]